jgi:2-methylcitrate dehydratase PrpD
VSHHCEPPASEVFARAVAATTWAGAPDDVRAKALELVTDAIAVIAGGASHETMTSLRRATAPGPGPATVIAGREGVDTMSAVLLNGAAITVLQRQDGYAHAKGHPASQLLPPLLAVAETRGLSGGQLLGAFMGGYEVAARVGVALGGVPEHLHDIGNWVTIGVSAATASLLSDRDEPAIAAAIDGASSLALSFDRFTTAAGATVHHLYPASAALVALTVAQGVAAGLSALPGSLERFYGPHLGKELRADRLTEGIDGAGRWDRYDLLDGYLKLHPSCAHLHGVNDAVAALIVKTGLREDDVDRVDVEIFGDGFRIDALDPQNDLAARFSVRATVAAAIVHGRLDDDGLADLDALRPLMARITVRHDQAMDALVPEGRPGRVTVHCRDGRTLVEEVTYPRGTPRVPATEDDRTGKILGLLGRCYDAQATERILDAVMALPDAVTLADLTAALRSSRPRAVSAGVPWRAR